MKTPAIGTLLHVRTHTLLGWAIRRALNRWLLKWCRKASMPVTGWEIWGSHDALIVPCQKSSYGIGVCQAEPIVGVVVTPWEHELERIKAGKIEVRFFAVLSATAGERAKAADNAIKYEVGKPYDWLGIIALEFKTLWGTFSDALDDWTWADWCTEAVGNAWRRSPPGMDVLQTEHPTPMTVEQCAGLLPRKPGKQVTLVEISLT